MIFLSQAKQRRENHCPLDLVVFLGGQCHNSYTKIRKSYILVVYQGRILLYEHENYSCIKN